MIGFVVVAVLVIALRSPGTALAAGMAFAMLLGNPLPAWGQKAGKYLLQACVVLLGFAMELPVILRAGMAGSLLAAATIATTLLLGYCLGKALRLNGRTSALISAGTAICGGSAIAAVATVLTVSEAEIAMAMGTVFILNAAALYLFPILGHVLHLSQHHFGIWAGIAIHDISSVVGASSEYGPEAFHVATAVKLSRTLWIVPVALGMSFAFGQGSRSAACADGGASPAATARRPRIAVPWFIGLFLLASLLRSLLPGSAVVAPAVARTAAGGMTLVLLVIGTGLSGKTLRSVGWQAAVQGVLLWAFISVVSLVAVANMP
jgi:uncharacterized integral membrane protein (TIGR00698 family)